MTEKYELSRRKALAALGTIGVAGAGAGLGTSALFSDEESFTNNQMVAGELDLFVDYWTGASFTVEEDTTGSGQNDGGVSAQYVLTDVKPGDSGKLVFCPKIVDNPAYLWAGSSGFTQYENGYTEPEADVEDNEISGRGGTESDYPADGSTSGEGYGELADNIQVTVAYCEPSVASEGEPEGVEDFVTVRELNNPDDYTLADLLLELQTGYLLDGREEVDNEWVPTDDGAYPSSPDSDTQTGPCICIDWEIPDTVGNVIQSDSVEFDIGFWAVQSRNVDNPHKEDPYADVSLLSGNYDDGGSNYTDDETGHLSVQARFGTDQTVFTITDNTGNYSNKIFAVDQDADGTADWQVIWQPGHGKLPSGTDIGYSGVNNVPEWKKDNIGFADPSNVSGIVSASHVGNTLILTVDNSLLPSSGDDFAVLGDAFNYPAGRAVVANEDPVTSSPYEGPNSTGSGKYVTLTRP